ncbi:OmpA/MotB domain protein [Dinoroseobacter shibae DFL 12 = DSM 16493]|jgi:outer membrane protein OmpA-like peptidoglycan-associated protein|uniref:OmpA/MotB domain protein n=1 Tax=Dinoroseobacter shibae (strain DSM 16493 / NCIMB 14021 / DFL 12) TaxID=398580 RepID=A8LKH5_DINSH|nr:MULTISPECIES: OmpA family protein [Dinoroseobacter]ABV94758.1 OmpA/MotB domain protein [Dinoroseobacter shibae DFL 12 = DSM 16493]MDD9716800.1 OmpA family protein [Dinoroseobacter sp. PD6]URF46178.1 OmpA family protein [Dinoroseobacter shibae]URF50485.1 OmpA family protein [Dinoroseobacter shibae]
MRVHVPLIAACASLLALSACTVTEDNRRMATGAAIGALAGGALGATEDREKALIGAVVGAGVGAAIGDMLDRQARDLQAELGNDAVQIVNTGSELVVTMPQDILFAVDSAVVQSTLQSDLAALSRNLLDYPDTTVQVVGHTDNTGSAGYNQELSQRRASAVAAILLQNGVPSSRVVAFGRGEDQPIASNLDEAGRAQNRRVEIIITPR